MYTVSLTADELISQIGELRIYQMFINSDLRPNKPINSPLRHDPKPSFGLFWWNNSLLYKDFGHSSGNVFQFVMELHKCNFHTAVKLINQKLKGFTPLKSSSIEEFKEKAAITYNYIPVYLKWSEYDKKYWYDYKISLDFCDKFDIRPILCVKCNDYYLKNYYKKENPFYAYHVNDHFRFYMPFSQNYKWTGNLNKNDIYGLKQLKYNSDTLFITSSLKDVMVLDILNYNAIAPSSESTFIPEKIFYNLLRYYKHIYIYYDNDKAGIQYCKKYQEKYGIKYINNPHRSGCKDPSDLAKKENLNMINTLIKNKIYSDK